MGTSAFSFFCSGHHLKMSCNGCEFHSAPLSLPSPFSLEANPLISCVSMDLQRTIFKCVCVCVFMCERQTERKRHSERVRCKNTLCCLCFCIIIIILYTPFWLQCYHALLNGRHLSLAIIFQSVLIHKSETLKMLQKTPCKCLCGWQAFTQFCSPTLVFESMR